MSKYRTIDVWNQVYGAEQEAYHPNASPSKIIAE